MTCYKCGSTHELSTKKTNKNGTKWMICRPCRRQDARDRKASLLEKELPSQKKLQGVAWRDQALASQLRILAKHGNLAKYGKITPC